MNDLTIRQLACYLGTGVKFRMQEQYNLNCNDEIMELNSRNFDWVVNKWNEYSYKLILRPLADLTKPCLDGGKVPIVELFEITFPNHKPQSGREYNYTQNEYNASCSHFGTVNEFTLLLKFIDSHSYKIVNWLHEKHFDTQNLIGQNLAIDINTLTKE